MKSRINRTVPFSLFSHFSLKEAPSALDPTSCNKLKDCIEAAMASSKETKYKYNGFNQDEGVGRKKVCEHWFRKEPLGNPKRAKKGAK